MEKQSHNKFKIKYILLSILFTILFIFTALNISIPLTAYADTTTTIGQTMNLDSYSANEDDESTNEQAGYLYWAASSKRCGVMYYVVDEKGVVQTNGLIMDRAGRDEFGYYTNTALGSTPGITGRDVTNKRVGGAILGAGVGSATTSIYWRDNVSPVAYSGGWQANGSSSMAYLMEDSGLTKMIKGNPVDLPNWAYFVYISGGGISALEQLAKPDTKWSVIVEPVSVNYMYTNNTFANDTVDATGMQWAAGSPMPAGATNEDGWSPIAYIGTGYRLIDVSNNVTGQVGGGTYTYKLYNKQLPFSLCLAEDIEIASYIGGMEGAKETYTGLTSSVHRIGSAREIGSEGIAMASIDITGFSLPPIHTFDGTNTPGNTEPPSDDNGTSGECTIKKLYYTQEIASDGTILTEATDYHHFTQSGTTNYISIDTEEDYEIEGWKTSSSDRTFTQKSHYDGISPVKHSGASSEIITLDETTGEKYLYVLYKKTEVNPNPPDPWDFQLKQSQITKRVTFLESSGPANTSSLVAHAFTWTAPAPSKTSCTSHGGNGHHLNCTKVWDEEPRAASGTPGTPGYDAGSSGVAHSHSDSCYDTPCTTFKWTDNTTKLGITLDTSTINKAVVSKNWSVTYNATTVNTISSSNKYYKENNSTRSGTGANTQSISQFNFITVLFRGQDHLTLADWKNGGPVSYLTTLAYDSAYNFKSANTPQGTRKSGTEYTETFAAKFVGKYTGNHQTTYGATVGAYGKCSTTSTYSFNDSSAYTIPNIKVNIQVFWAQGVSPSASGTLPSTQTAGQATFYPYIRMRYDNNTLTDRKVYVLGQTRRTVTFYDYATVYISGGDKELTINSNQWSTHSDAMNNILSKFSGRTLSTTEENRVKSSVLPGGATLSLSVNSSNTRQIVVKTIQAYLTGSGKTQVDVTGGNSSLPTDRTQLESIHTGLVSSVSGVASQAYIAQYICTGAKLNSSEMTGAQFVQPGQEFTGNGTRFSTDTKYHFNGYTDSKLNTHVNSPSYSTYTFYTDTMGNIRCSKNNTSPSETSGTIIATKGSNTLTGGDSVMREIANKTGVILALRKGLVDNEGDDPEAPWAPDGKWYNEAFDGVTYLYAVSTIDIGIWDPLERNTVLDPKTTPTQSSKGSFFTEFNSSFFRSMINGGPTVNVGTFVNSNGKSRTLSLNFGDLYESKVFYIPNVTTQDLK